MQQAVRDALIGFMAATASGQAEATKAAQRAGIEHAKQSSDRAYLGRNPSFSATNSTPRVPCWGRKPWESHRLPRIPA
jgi:putative DNA-invertase from lambdoid prophage Rac